MKLLYIEGDAAQVIEAVRVMAGALDASTADAGDSEAVSASVAIEAEPRCQAEPTRIASPAAKPQPKPPKPATQLVGASPITSLTPADELVYREVCNGAKSISAIAKLRDLQWDTVSDSVSRLVSAGKIVETEDGLQPLAVARSTTRGKAGAKKPRSPQETADLVIAAVTSGCKTIGEIAKHSEMAWPTVKGVVKRLVGDGVLAFDGAVVSVKNLPAERSSA